MRRNYTSVLSVLFIVIVLAVIYFTMMPQWISKNEVPPSEFSVKRAIEQVRIISQQPHYVGSDNHAVVASYIEQELRKLGLQPQIQEGTTLTDWGNLVKSHNIIARIKGTANSKPLILLSHYDSAPHSYSHGAADDASGVAVILESVRAFLHTGTQHKNDIIVLFTDAEELGLNGAALFVAQNNWSKEAGIVLNFEARGSSGPGYMLMEVNRGNSKIVDAFAAADVKYPVSNSLMYSIYKMLPNDTDLTVFREQGKIQGLNFAFIDDHFNYHTQQDDIAHLSEKTLAHQGSYLVPLLNYFSNADLSDLNSAEDQIYFNAPFSFFHYSFSWTFPLLAISFVLFLFLLFVGIAKRVLVPREIGHGFITMSGLLIVSGAIGYLGWKALLAFYPQYNDIPQGFTYNGHCYIAAFTFLTLSLAFLFYRNLRATALNASEMVAPLVLWLILNLAVAVALPGAGFLIIPVIFSLLTFAFIIVTQRTSTGLSLVFAIPALIIIAPFIVMFPIGLGLKILFATMLLTVLLFMLLLPIFAGFQKKRLWSLVFFLISLVFFVIAHVNSGYEPGKAKPNSLLYVYDADADYAVWATYDKKLDDWTKIYLDNPKPADKLADLQLFSKYNSGFSYVSKALIRDLPEPTIVFTRDSIVGTNRYLTIKVSPNRRVNRYDIFANQQMVFQNLTANGATAIGQQGSEFKRNGRKILSYYVVDNEPLELSFSIGVNSVFDMELLESSFDLMQNPLFEMKQRPGDRMPTPFILNDAIAIRKRIRPGTTIAAPVPVKKEFRLSRAIVNDTIDDPDAASELPVEQ